MQSLADKGSLKSFFFLFFIFVIPFYQQEMTEVLTNRAPPIAPQAPKMAAHWSSHVTFLIYSLVHEI